MREFAIVAYLFIIRLIYTLFNMLPLKDKATFIVSFGDNTQYVYEEMLRQDIPFDAVFLCKGKSIDLFKDYESAKVIPFESGNFLNLIQSIYHVATSKRVIVDNYFGFLAAVDFRDEVECIQLWHATGAIKKFGLEDKSVTTRTKAAQQRFRDVYDRFDKVIVGSDVMATIFGHAFGLDDSRILRTGIPRTDFFFNEQEIRKNKQQLVSQNPALAEKKVILYAPTYRDAELDQFKLQLDIEKMEQELGRDHVLVLRLHPAVKNDTDYASMFPGFVYDYSSGEYNINDLLSLADILISDYSSIPYEFSLLKRPMIFFAYDLEEYKRDRGIAIDEFPGPIVRDTESIIELIKKDAFDYGLIEKYAAKWNKYSRGNASAQLVGYMFGKEAETIREQRRAL
ncbi:CDP-glycerol glycerophosphotransferase family protein [Bacillus sp. EB01]|uniref:CDP-glycerol glycerophosphotransferase family protein n=1 Tax=Bacillus sp. EB01 TaxID=1347086 RepID=UPI000694BCAC|nr:CDP-glycerol glycerophosphotransferase family protein [Bacillus sp. EB01]